MKAQPGTKVYNVNPLDPSYGRAGILERYVTVRKEKKAVVRYFAGDLMEATVAYVYPDGIKAERDFTESAFGALLADADATRAVRAAAEAERRAERRAEAIAAYLAERTKPVPALVVTERDYGIDEERRSIEWNFPDRYSNVIGVDIDPKRYSWGATLPTVTVHWSAIGTTSPQEALSFAKALMDAATRAIAEQAALERATPEFAHLHPVEEATA